MWIFDGSLQLYRQTIKRVYPLHMATHWMVSRLAVPLLEQWRGFRTMPDDPFWFRAELLLYLHEKATRQRLLDSLRPGMTVLDVGAHVGYYARLAAGAVGPGGRVLAFEPHPRTFAILQDNVRPYHNVALFQAGLSDAPGTAQLYDYLMMSASGSLHYDPDMADLVKQQVNGSDIAPRIAADFPVQSYEVALLCADDLLAEMGIEQVDVIKMDIEGAELDALRGLRQTIARSESLLLIMEYNPQALAAFGHAPQPALAEVLSLGFQRVQIIEDDGRLSDVAGDDASFAQLTEALMAKMGVVNLLFSR